MINQLLAQWDILNQKYKVSQVKLKNGRLLLFEHLLPVPVQWLPLGRVPAHVFHPKNDTNKESQAPTPQTGLDYGLNFILSQYQHKIKLLN